jgi:pimeloyl-ACP methyl ester carboxylesterase
MVRPVAGAIEEFELVVDGVKVFWGDRDPYLPTKFAHSYADVLPSSELEIVEGAGHWPWIDDARVIDHVCSFVE